MYNLYRYFIEVEAFNELKNNKEVLFLRELINCFFMFMKPYGAIDEKGQL